jgi:WD40 repeat protein
MIRGTGRRPCRPRTLLSGPLAPFSDLGHVDSPDAGQLRRALGQAAHLLAATEPSYSVVDILLSRLGHEPTVREQASLLAAGRTTPGLVNGWPLPDLPSPSLRRALSIPGAAIGSMAISADSQWIATVDDGGSARIWDVAGGMQRCRLSDAGSKILDVAIASDGTWLATRSDDGLARIWDPETGRLSARLTASGDRLVSLDVVPDSTALVTSDSHGITRVWDIATRTERHGWAPADSSLNGVVIAPDGSWLARTNLRGAVELWDIATGVTRAWLRSVIRMPVWRWSGVGPSPSRITTGPTVAVTPDSAGLVVINNAGDICLCDSHGRERRVITAYTAGLTSLTISPNGTWLATTGRDESVRIWDLRHGRPRRLTEPGSCVGPVTISPDATWLATIGADGVARIWDVATGRRRADLTGHAGPVTSLAVAPDGGWLATVGDDGSVRIWDATAGAAQPRSAGGRIDEVEIIFAPDGSRFVSRGHDPHDPTSSGTVRIHDAATGEPYVELPGVQVRRGALAIAPDSRWLVTANDIGPVTIWDLATGRRLAAMKNYARHAVHVAVSPDGGQIEVRQRDNTTRRWDIRTREEIGQAPAFDSWTKPDDPPVRAATVTQEMGWSPDRSWFAVASGRTIRISPSDAADPVAIMRVDHDVSSCAWTPSGDALVVSGSAGLYKFEFRRPGGRIPRPRTPGESDTARIRSTDLWQEWR